MNYSFFFVPSFRAGIADIVVTGCGKMSYPALLPQL